MSDSTLHQGSDEMSFSMYEASIPLFRRGLEALSAILGKGSAYAAEHNIDEASFIEARLAPDMMTLAQQVQRASDTTKFALVRLTGTEGPSFADNETTFDALRERCAKTIAYAESFEPAAFEGSVVRIVTFGSSSNSSTLGGEHYLFQFALPNFYFHVATAYDILRYKGVPLSKRDYIGPFRAE